MTLQSLLLFLLLLQIKHFVADFMLQSSWIVRTKGIYGHPGGLVHAGLHASFSLVILLLAPLTLVAILGVCAAEFVIHYHIDWTKDQFVWRLGATPTEWRFWALMGADQLAHQVTYVAMLVMIPALV